MTTKTTFFEDWGIIDYAKAWHIQEFLFNKMLNNKLHTPTNLLHNHLIFCEHPNVFTIGKNGSAGHLLIDEEILKTQNIAVHHTNRGGEITYHGLGQLVAYPILDLDNFSISIRQYVDFLEEVIIRTLQTYGIEAKRIAGAPGVWVSESEKIAAIGVKTSRMITMHGLALNVKTDISYFEYINPCGFKDKKATSMHILLEKKVRMADVKNNLLDNFSTIFGTEIVQKERDLENFR